MTVQQKLKDAEAKAKEIRAEQKRVLRAIKHARGSHEVLAKIKSDPDEVNVEFALDGDVSFDFDLDEYPELKSDVRLLVEKLHAAALEQVG